MGNCSGIKFDNNNNEEVSIEIYGQDSSMGKIKQDHEQNCNYISQIIEITTKLDPINQMVDNNEINQVIENISDFNLEGLKNLIPHQLQRGYICNPPSTKHTLIDTTLQKQLNENFKQHDDTIMGNQEMIYVNETKKNIVLSEPNLQYLKYYDGGGETILNKIYKPIRVYSRVGEDKESKNLEDKAFVNEQDFYINNIGQSDTVLENKCNLVQEEDKCNFEQEDEDDNDDELVIQTESDCNYEGSEDENVKIKEKLIDKLFINPSHWNKQLTIIDESSDLEPSRILLSSPKNIQGRNNIKEILKNNSQRIQKYRSFSFQGGIFQGEVIDSKRNGFGQQTYLDGTVYMGEWKSDKRCGKGVQIWPDDTMYEGQWQNDFIEGIGKIQYSNKSFYIGEWNENKFHGKGRFQHFSGAYYEGQWDQDVQQGKGVEVQLFPHYSRYEGIFEFGKKQGKGRLLMGNGSSYKGDFVDNNVHGLGVYNWLNGIIYEGMWENNKMQGKGKMTWPNNIVYQGEFSNDQKSGIGIVEYDDGNKYIGEWKIDKQNGIGTFYFKQTNSQIKGVWQNGRLKTITSYLVPKESGNFVQKLVSNCSIKKQERNLQQKFVGILAQNTGNSTVIYNGTQNNALMLPASSFDIMIKSVNSPKYSDFQMPEILNSQRSGISLDNQQQASYKSERLKAPQLNANQKYSNNNNNFSVFRQSVTLKVEKYEK